MTTPDVAEGDERPSPVEDNSLGRLLALCDGVFAIAMTLLALDLRVPELGEDPTPAALGEALAANGPSYLSFAVSFYAVAGYWSRHRRLMSSVTAIHPRLTTHTLMLLFVVAALPFPAGLLGSYGSQPLALAIYGAMNALAVVTLLLLRRDIGRLGLAGGAQDARSRPSDGWQLWGNLAVFLLCIPAAYLLGSRGPYVLLLLVLVGRLQPLLTRRRSG